MPKQTDRKLPCATCQKLEECEPALELFMSAKAIGETIKSIGITCPIDGATYRATRRTNEQD